VIGLPKCGTTDFAAKIGRHPLLSMSRKKEPHFWTRCNRKRQCALPDQPSTAEMTASFEHYLNEWNADRILASGAIAYEASASTFWEFHPYATHGVTLSIAELIRAAYGTFAKQLKLVVLFREPTSRAWSDYTYFSARHTKKQAEQRETVGASNRKQNPPLSRPNQNTFHQGVVEAIAAYNACFRNRTEIDCATDSSLRNTRDGRLGIGLYEPVLREWAKVFGADQLLPLRAEDFWNEPEKELDRVFSFLNLPPMPKEAKESVKDLIPSNSQSTGALSGKALEYEKYLAIDRHMQNDTRLLLSDFFRPFDKKLKVALAEMHEARPQIAIASSSALPPA
jgi:hypothetical protein